MKFIFEFSEQNRNEVMFVHVIKFDKVREIFP